MKGWTHLDAMMCFRILWKRRWYALVLFILAVSVAVICASLHQDIFISETIIAVHYPYDPGEGFPVPSTPEERSNNLRAMISNRTLLEKIIIHLKMYGYGTNSNFTMEHAVETAQGYIGVKEISNLSTYVISFIASDPQLVQAVTRQLAWKFHRDVIGDRLYSLLGTNEFINAELITFSKDLAAQEEKIEEFLTAHSGELPKQKSTLIALFPGKPSLSAIAENIFQQSKERQKRFSLIRDDLRKTTLSDQMDSTKALIKFEEDSFKDEFKAHEKEIQNKLQQIELLQRRPGFSPSQEPQFDALLGELRDILENQYKLLEKTPKAITSLSETIGLYNNKNDIFRIIKDANLPVNPEFPTRVQIILMGIVGGLLLCISAAFIREIMDSASTLRKLRTDSETGLSK